MFRYLVAGDCSFAGDGEKCSLDGSPECCVVWREIKLRGARRSVCEALAKLGVGPVEDGCSAVVSGVALVKSGGAFVGCESVGV